LESELREVVLEEKPRKVQPDARTPKDRRKKYRRTLVGLMPWLRSQLIQGGMQESGPHPITCMTTTMKSGSWTIQGEAMELHAGGSTT